MYPCKHNNDTSPAHTHTAYKRRMQMHRFKHTLTMKEFGLLHILHHSRDIPPINNTPTLVCKRETMNEGGGGGGTYTLQHGCVNTLWVQSTSRHSFFSLLMGIGYSECERERLHTAAICPSWFEILSSSTWAWCSLQAGFYDRSSEYKLSNQCHDRASHQQSAGVWRRTLCKLEFKKTPASWKIRAVFYKITSRN